MDEGNTIKYLWWEEQLCKVEAAAKDNSKFWRQVNRIQGKPSNQMPSLKSIIGDREYMAETQEEKIKLLTNIWSNIYHISHLENQQFCQITENNVKEHLNNIADKITPKWIIDFDELVNHSHDYLQLKIDVDDVKFAIKSLKDDRKTLITIVTRDISKAFDKVHKDSLIYNLNVESHKGIF